jgi:hypothetical protein
MVDIMKIIRQLDKYLFLFIVSLVSTTYYGTVHAELTQADLVVGSGDRLIVRDTDSQLDWLVLTETQGLSVVDVIDNGIGGYTDMGFDLASVEQVEALFFAGGVVELNTGFVEENFEPVSFLINLLGCVQGCDGGLPTAQGWVQAPDLQDWVLHGVLQTASCCPPSGRAYVLNISASPKTTRSDVNGIFLVRPTPKLLYTQKDLEGIWFTENRYYLIDDKGELTNIDPKPGEIIHDFRGAFTVNKKIITGSIYIDHTPSGGIRNVHYINYFGFFQSSDEINMDWDVPGAGTGSESWKRISYTDSTDLNIFGLELGNQWNYKGTYQGGPYSTGWKIIDTNQSDYPAPTYIYEIKENGVVVGTEWYENAGDQIKLWQMTIEDEGNYYNISFSQGLLVAWAPMKVFDHKYSEATTNILGLPFNVSMTVDVLSIEPVILAFDTLEAYKVQYQFHLWGNGINETTTFTRWIVPYLGVVKEQGTDYILELTSFAIGGDTVTYPGDKDEDGLSDYDELFKFNTYWLFADSDNDGLNDGSEVLYWGSDWNKDPDGDLFVNLVDPDSDNDGLKDGIEVNTLGTNPVMTDTDGNGITDGDEDNDGDGFTNSKEVLCHSDPADPSSRCFIGFPWLLLLLD